MSGQADKCVNCNGYYSNFRDNQRVNILKCVLCETFPHIENTGICGCSVEHHQTTYNESYNIIICKQCGYTKINTILKESISIECVECYNDTRGVEYNSKIICCDCLCEDN